MTREEILKIMVRELDDIKMRDYNPLWAAEWILGILSDCDVVIKVDRELSDNPHKDDYEMVESGALGSYAYGEAQQDMLKAGYVAVEPLIGREREVFPGDLGKSMKWRKEHED